MEKFIVMLKHSHDDLKVEAGSNAELNIAGLKLCLVETTKLHGIDAARKHLATMKADGVLLHHSNAALRRWLEQNQISYIAIDGYACLFALAQTYIIRPSPRRKHSQYQGGFGSTSASADFTLRPTMLLSPAGLKMLDTVIRLPKSALKDLTGQQLAVKLGISQSAVSKVLAMSKPRRLIDFRQSILKLTSSSWLDAMDDPRTVRQLTPYFRVAHSYRLPDRELTPKESNAWALDVTEQFGAGVQLGPLEFAKAAGKIVDKRVTLWCEARALQALKRHYKLVPAGSTDTPLCMLATPTHSFDKEAIDSSCPHDGEFAMPTNIQRLNLFRAIWDLGFSDSRAKEMRHSLLEVVLSAAR